MRASKVSAVKYMRGANRRDTRRQKVCVGRRLALRAWNKAVRREGKQVQTDD